MLVQNSVYRNTYLTDGVNKDFYFSFPILEASQVLVQTSLLTDTDTVTTVDPGQYTVTGVGLTTGGHISFTTAPPTGSRIALTLNIPITQLYQYAELDSFPAKSHEDALAKLTLICQQLKEQISRAVLISATSEGSTADIIASLYAARDEAQAAAQIAIGNASASPVLATNTAVARTLADRFYDTVNVKDFGAVGDGVHDDTEAIQAAFNACALGSTVDFGKGETYRVDPLISRNASVINLNGSAIVRRAPFSSGTLLTIQPNSVTYTGLSIPVTENQNSFIASGVSVSVGDLLLIGSTDTSVDSYTHGQYAKVTAVVGSKIYISTPIYSAYTITSIRVYVGKASVSLVNGALDISQSSEVAQTSAALTMIGSNLLIDGVTATGNYYTGYLFNLAGENAVVQRCHLNTCLNVLGDGGEGRVGYGINCVGNNFNVRSCIFNDTKHAFTSASRSVMAIKLSLADSTIYESPTELPEPDYKGSIDLHCNVRGIFAIDNVRVFAEGIFLQNRAPSASVKISNSYFSQWKPNSIATQGVEVDLQGLVFRDCAISLASGGTLFPTTPTALSTEVRNVLIDSCIVTGGALAFGRMPLVDVTVRGCTLTQPLVIYIAPLSGDKSWSGISFVDNHVASAQALTLLTLVGGASKKLVITGNTFLRTNTTSTSILQVKSTLNDSAASAEDINISGNSFEYLTGDTSITDGLSFRDMAITRLNISNNFIKRINTAANAITLRNTSIYRGNLIGNNTDTSVVIYASPTAVTLSSVTVVGNTGASYKVLAGLGSVTKARYKFDTGSNSFDSVDDSIG